MRHTVLPSGNSVNQIVTKVRQRLEYLGLEYHLPDVNRLTLNNDDKKEFTADMFRIFYILYIFSEYLIFNIFLWTQTAAYESIIFEPESTLLCLTHFMPLISFDTPWKHQKPERLSVFRGYKKRSVAWNGLIVLDDFQKLLLKLMEFN